MNPKVLRLIAMTIFGSFGLAAITLRATGSILLAFLSYSVGGAALMAILAGIMVWRMGRNAASAGAKIEDWEQDLLEEKAHLSDQNSESAPEKKRNVG